MNTIGIALRQMGVDPQTFPPHSDLRAQGEDASHAADEGTTSVPDRFNAGTVRRYTAQDMQMDYVCQDHQCLASQCGCLEDYVRAHCPKCRMRYMSSPYGPVDCGCTLYEPQETARLSHLVAAEKRNRLELATALFDLLSRKASPAENPNGSTFAYAHPDYWVLDGHPWYAFLTHAYMDSAGRVVIRTWADSPRYADSVVYYADRDQGGTTWVYKSPKNLANHLRTGPGKSMLAELVLIGEKFQVSDEYNLAQELYEPDRQFNAVLP